MSVTLTVGLGMWSWCQKKGRKFLFPEARRFLPRCQELDCDPPFSKVLGARDGVTEYRRTSGFGDRHFFFSSFLLYAMKTPGLWGKGACPHMAFLQHRPGLPGTTSAATGIGLARSVAICRRGDRRNRCPFRAVTPPDTTQHAV